MAFAPGSRTGLLSPRLLQTLFLDSRVVEFEYGVNWRHLNSHTLTGSPTVQVNIKNLIDDAQCYQTVRELRWPEGVACPSCESKQVIKRGFDDTEPDRQRYECHDCHTRFDDLTDTIFAGHHQPLKVWIWCLYFMGLNLSNDQIAEELALNSSDVHYMTTELRGGIVKKNRR